jgi:uncharacterized protein (DUF58 family)
LSRSLFLGVITYSLILIGIIGVRGELLALALPFVVYLLAGFLRAPAEIKLEATRHLSNERVGPNSEVVVTVTVTNRGSHLEEVLLDDIVPPELKFNVSDDERSKHRFLPNRHLVRLAKDASFTFAYTVVGPRGSYGFENLEATVNDHIAVTRQKVRVEAKGQLFVFPPVLRLRHVAIRPRRTRVYAGSIPARVGGSGTEFFGVREYQPGDPSRAINWRASAHHEDQLFANEFQQERVADVGIVLDGRLLTNQFPHGHSLFEYSVQAAAALSDALLAQGNRVGLLVYGTFLRWTLPGYGKVQRERILYALAHARSGGSEVFSDLEHLPTRLFPPESQIMLISPLVDDDLPPLVQLCAQGYQLMAICPDPVRFELSYLPKSKETELAGRVLRMERTLLLQKVQHAGIQVLDWDVDEPFDQVVKRKLSRPPAWLRAVGR